VLLDPHRQALDAAGVEMELVTLGGEPVSGLRRYLRSHTEIAFLACKDTGYLGRSYLNSVKGKNSLPVPVVVVTTATEDSRVLDQPAVDSSRGGAVVA